jgi:hypothetical protein
MSVLKPRNRLVYFRVSEDEFLQFSEICQSAGARSLSDLARLAVQQMLAQRAEEAQVAQRLRTFDELISVLNDRLGEMNDLLRENRANPGLQRPKMLAGTSSQEQERA